MGPRIAFGEAGPVEAGVKEERRRDSVDVVKGGTVIDPGEKVTGYVCTEAPATVFQPIVKPVREEELVFIGGVDIEATEIGEETVGADGVVEVVVVAIGCAGGVRRGDEAEDIARDWIDSVGGDDVIGERFATDTRTFAGTGEGVVDLIAGADREKAGKVATALGFGGDSGEGGFGLGLLDAFIGEVPKGFIFPIKELGEHDGAGSGEPVLIKAGDGLFLAGRVRKELRGLEGGDLIEEIGSAVEVVRAALHDDVDGASAGVAVGSVGLKDFDFDFGDRVGRGVVGDAAIAGHVRRAVKEEFVGLALTAAHRETGGAAVVERTGEAGIGGGDDAEGELGERERGAPVHRHGLQLGGGDDLADGGGGGVEKRYVSVDGDAFGDGAEAESDVLREALVGADADAGLHVLFEAVCFGGKFIVTGRNEGKGEGAVGGGDGFVTRICGGFAEAEFCAGDGGTLGVCDLPGERGTEFLREERERAQRGECDDLTHEDYTSFGKRLRVRISVLVDKAVTAE